MEGFLCFTVLIVKLNFTAEDITTSYLFRPGLLSRSPRCYCVANLNTANVFFFACVLQRTHLVNLRSFPPAGP